MSGHVIYGDAVPFCYGFSWQAEPPALVLLVNPGFVAGAMVVPADDLIAKGPLEKFGLESFAGDLEGESFGFNGALVHQGNDGELVRYCVAIPQFEELGNDCGECKGTGERDGSLGRNCLHCQGLGKERILHRERLWAISASFDLFFLLARSFNRKEELTSPYLQLMEITLGGDMGGCGFGVECGPAVSKWLWHCPEEKTASEILEAVKLAYSTMSPLERKGKFYGLGVGLKEGRFTVYLPCGPGDATGIFPEQTARQGAEEEGISFTSANLDTVEQQLLALVAFAKLHDLVWQDLHSS